MIRFSGRCTVGTDFGPILWRVIGEISELRLSIRMSRFVVFRSARLVYGHEYRIVILIWHRTSLRPNEEKLREKFSTWRDNSVRERDATLISESVR